MGLKNYYDKNILPCLVHKVCARSPFMELRQRVIPKLAGVGLELGVGTGLNFDLYTKKVEKLYIIEPCAKSVALALNVAKKNGLNIERVHYENEVKIPLEKESLDFVVSTWTLCTIPRLIDTLKEVRTLLKPEGRFYFIEHGLHPSRFIGGLQHTLTPVHSVFSGGCHLDRPIDVMIEQAGMKIVSLEKYVHPEMKLAGQTFFGVAKP